MDGLGPMLAGKSAHWDTVDCMGSQFAGTLLTGKSVCWDTVDWEVSSLGHC